MAFLEAAAAQQQEINGGATEWSAAVKELGEATNHKDIGRRMLYFRVRYLFTSKDTKEKKVAEEEKQCKVIFAMSGGKTGDPTHEGLTAWLVKNGAEEAIGTAPPSNMEWEAHKLFNQQH